MAKIAESDIDDSESCWGDSVLRCCCNRLGFGVARREFVPVCSGRGVRELEAAFSLNALLVAHAALPDDWVGVGEVIVLRRSCREPESSSSV